LSIRGKKITALFVPVIIVLVLDQITKYMVRTNPDLHRVELIEGWLALNFTKNPGMAMGMDWLSTPTISVIAIVATIGILSYILMTLEKANFAYLTCMGLILGGAVGNIADRIFMGIIGGYGGVLHGHVVDFIHFTLTIGDWPVFPYIFNVADIAISTSIIVLLLFHKKIMPITEEEEKAQSKSAEEQDKTEELSVAGKIEETKDEPVETGKKE
jgi:signal peptidase II